MSATKRSARFSTDEDHEKRRADKKTARAKAKGEGEGEEDNARDVATKERCKESCDETAQRGKGERRKDIRNGREK